MGSLRELARALQEAESPLWAQYQALSSGAATDVERELAGHLVDSQQFQLSFLELMTTPLPNRLHCFAKIVDDDVKFRQGPGAAHPQIGELHHGTPCLVIQFEGLWANLQLPDGTRGWVFKDYVQCERGGGNGAGNGSSEPPVWKKAAPRAAR